MADYLLITCSPFQMLKGPVDCDVCMESVGCAVVIMPLGGAKLCFPCLSSHVSEEPPDSLLNGPCPCGSGLRLKQCCLTRSSAN